MVWYHKVLFRMVNGKDKKSLQKRFFTRNSLAKRLQVHASVVERLLFRDVFVPDAWIVRTSSLEDPIFDVNRLEELRCVLLAFNAQVEEARRQQFASK